MRASRLLHFGCVMFLIAAVSGASRPAKNAFSIPLPQNQRALHAVQRLTFGARPGEIERVQAQGVDRWIDVQLHPEKIAENPDLAVKLRPLETIRMEPEEMMRQYPSPAILKALADGKLAYPKDPAKRSAVERLVANYEKTVQIRNSDDVKEERAAQREDDRSEFEQAAPAIVGLEQLNQFERAGPEGKEQFLLALSEDDRGRMFEILPQALRRRIYTLFPTPVERRLLWSFAPQQVVAQDLTEAKLYRAIYSNRELEEVLVDFWFNHFNVFLDKGADHYLVTSYERDTIRPHVLGKFKDMLIATAGSPAMLFYLDNWQSSAPKVGEKNRRGLNENYARELLELHTLGVDGGYTQQDVIEVARCFTGWTLKKPRLGGGFDFNPRMHDNGAKTVLGVGIPAGGGMNDGLRVLDLLAHHRSTAHFISRQLAVRFVGDDAPPELVERMAATFLKTDGDLRAVMRTMLHSKEFFSQGAYDAKIKSPLELVASALRAVDAQVDSGVALAHVVMEMGEPLYRKEEPTGYSNANAAWINSAALLARMNFVEGLAANRILGVHCELKGLAGFSPDQVAARLAPGSVGQPTRDALEKRSGSPLAMAALVLGSPEFQHK